MFDTLLKSAQIKKNSIVVFQSNFDGGTSQGGITYLMLIQTKRLIQSFYYSLLESVNGEIFNQSII